MIIIFIHISSLKANGSITSDAGSDIKSLLDNLKVAEGYGTPMNPFQFVDNIDKILIYDKEEKDGYKNILHYLCFCHQYVLFIFYVILV